MSPPISPTVGPGIVRPHPITWTLVLGGVGLLGVLAASETAYDAYHRIIPWPSQRTLRQMFVATAVIHLGEALVAARLARRAGDPAGPWFWQTLAMGGFSLRHLIPRARAAR